MLFSNSITKHTNNTFFILTISSFNNNNYRGSLLINSLMKRSFSNLPVKIKKHSFVVTLIRKLLMLVSVYILYIRSFFLKDRTYFFLMPLTPCISAVFLLLSKIYPDIITAFTASYFFIWIGIQLLVYDELGSRISFHALNDIDPILSMTTLLAFSKNKNFILRHITFSAAKSLIIGKTAMSATGRASLIVGSTTGGAWLYNSYRDRQSQTERANADRQAQNERANADRQAQNERANADRYAQNEREAKSRAYQNYTRSRQQYDSTPFYKKKAQKPEWDEALWEKWSKSA